MRDKINLLVSEEVDRLLQTGFQQILHYLPTGLKPSLFTVYLKEKFHWCMCNEHTHTFVIKITSQSKTYELP